MLINGVPIANLGAQLYDRVLTSNAVDTTQEWLDGDLQPTFIRQQDSFKNMTLKFLILSANEEDAFVIMSNLAMALKKATIVFDDIDLEFLVTMEGVASQRRLKNGNFIYTVHLKSDYARGKSEIHTTNTSATNSFRLTLIYYKDGKELLSTETVPIQAATFNDITVTNWSDLGIDVDKYLPTYYNNGVVTNFSGLSLTYDNLYSTGTIIINYSPTVYSKPVEYYINTNGAYTLVESTIATFTHQQVAESATLGQIIDFNKNRPTGYRATTSFNLDYSFDNILNFALPIQIYYDVIPAEKAKDVTLNFYAEDDFITSTVVNVREGRFVDGTTFNDVFNIDGYNPNPKYYLSGAFVEVDKNSLISFEDLADSYTIRYTLKESPVLVEYYYGTYPNWLLGYQHSYTFKYNPNYENSNNIISTMGINLDLHKTDDFENGIIFNGNIFTDYDSVINAGVVQIYYVPKEYTVSVKYQQDDEGTITELGVQDYTFTALDFMTNPKLGEVININALRPTGYSFDEDESYKGEVSLSALTTNSPIVITYKPVEMVRTKSIVIKYKKELNSAFSTINTSVITIEEASVGGGIKLKNLIEMDKYKPDYYESGILNGYSSDALVTYDEIQGTYDVYYLASTYKTSVRYYTDEVAAQNWIGSESISYTILSFNIDTTLTSLGVNLNLYKPSYCGDGESQYVGAVTFENMINTASIDIVYPSISEPQDDGDIKYPHRILFLQHNDMGSYDSQFPSWTLNHAYINTGVSNVDMSKLTVSVSTVRVFEDQPLYEVNVGDAYLFGSRTNLGEFYLKYQNNTKYTASPTGTNYFIAMAGRGTPALTIEETSSNGFSRNTGIYASDRAGYSYATLTYSNLLQTNDAQMIVPLYLFGCDTNGHYSDGIAGVGITSCKIYYNNVLIRDFVPVQYYDLIGTKVAPSNCLYDKVTQTFFEDATGLNSFNIMDDPEYTNTDPQFQIGSCRCDYYKGGEYFYSKTFYFRGSDFVNGSVWDPEIELEVDETQPDFYGTGTITNISDLGGITFNNVKGFTFKVNYPATGYYITVEYYKDQVESGHLLKSEQVYLREDQFYSVPTFGQLVELNKYKPNGYKLAQYPYSDTKVTLKRLLNNSPYTVLYTEYPNPQTYTFTVKYYKHKLGLSPKQPLLSYDWVKDVTVTVDETQLVDGVYPEDFIDFNAGKPEGEEAFWYDGETFEWYKRDENLTDPSKLRDEYIVVYEPTPQTIELRYYTDEVDELNLIATDSWSVKINDWNFGEEFQIVDELPNNYINKYRPFTCWGGILQEPEKQYTFASLVEQGHLDIVYPTKTEPHDPEDDSFEQKIIMYTAVDKNNHNVNYGEVFGSVGDAESRGRVWQLNCGVTSADNLDHTYGSKIPYLNLGYTPKEIQRLKFEVKAYSVSATSSEIADYANYNTPMGLGGPKYAPHSDCYMYFLGYVGAMPTEWYTHYIEGHDNGKTRFGGSCAWASQTDEFTTKFSPDSYGWMGIRGHCVYASGFSKQYNGFWNVDGNTAAKWDNDGQAFITTPYAEYENSKTLLGGFRFGRIANYDENFEWYQENHDHVFYKTANDTKDKIWYNGVNAMNYCNSLYTVWDAVRSCNGAGICSVNASHTMEENVRTDTWQDYPTAALFHPYTMILDAYNKYAEIYDESNYNNPQYWNVDTSDDLNLFVDREKPKGPITLFLSTNPRTGKVNMLTEGLKTLPYIVNYNTTINETTEGGKDKDEGEESQSGSGGKQSETSTQDPTETHGGFINGMAYNPYLKPRVLPNCPWGDIRYNPFPVPMRTAIWYVKIWDRDKLVRNLIPVAKGDQIYDYVMPDNGMFDLVTEIFFGNQNQGGTYTYVRDIRNAGGTTFTEGPLSVSYQGSYTVTPDEVLPLRVYKDPMTYGKITVNYYNENNEFLGNTWASIPTNYWESNIAFKDILKYNEMKPNDFYHDGMFDADYPVDVDHPTRETLKAVYDAGTVNIYYKQRQYTKTITYYFENQRIATKDIFFSLNELKSANTLADLGVDVNLYANDNFAPGQVYSDETLIAQDDMAAFLDAPSPVVVYRKYTKEERPDLLYLEYYRGGAYEPEGEEEIVVNSENRNYLDCDLTAVVLNPNGLIKYFNHYHSALYEDEEMPYFLSYQVDVLPNYCNIHKGPARGYSYLATITDKGRYTVIEERNGWGRLKEYPKGWINLAYTRKVTGPGQNPSYDSNAGKNLVTIPFGTRLSITKMTIDRLWAYTPEYASWIKTEEISFDQSGRLYNSLALNVIHLDQVDWENVSSLSDLGIDPEKYVLRFHDHCNYTYNGEYTREAFEELHSIDFVYPETVYPYVCKYYDGYVDENKLLGTKSFSCTISDWNPDWDTFIDTSWQTNSQGYAVNPTLYRDTPITLDWSFFGIEKNAFKPNESYEDGMFLWNPHTYEGDNIYFNFEEIITTGYQSIIYLPKYVKNFKLLIRKGWYEVPTDINEWKLVTSTAEPGKYDIEIKYKHNSDFTVTPYNGSNTSEAQAQRTEHYAQRTNLASSTRIGEPFFSGLSKTSQNNVAINNAINSNNCYTTGFNDKQNNYNIRLADAYSYQTSSTAAYRNDVQIFAQSEYIPGDNHQYYQIVNFSNKRPMNQAVAQRVGDEYTKWQQDKPTFFSRLNNILRGTYTYYNSNGSTSTRSYTGVESFDASKFIIGAGSLIKDAHGDYQLYDSYIKTTLYYIKVWDNYYLIHYYVPLPRGSVIPGTDTQITENCLYDLITHTTVPYSLTSFTAERNNQMETPVLQKIGSGAAYNWFSEQTYDNQSVHKAATGVIPIVYQAPDILSNKYTSQITDAKIRIPLFKETTDPNLKGGTWYFTGKGWIKGSETTIDQNSTSLNWEEYNSTITLKGDDYTSATYNGFVAPEDGAQNSALTFTTETIIPVKAKCGDWYWTGSMWIPAQYTDKYVDELDPEETYIVATDYVYGYNYAIYDSQVGYRFQRGDRVKVVAKLHKQPNWFLTDEGYWIWNQNTMTKLES